MYYVRFPGTIETARGDFEELVTYVDKVGAVGIVLELRDGLTKIDEQTYETERDAILEHNADIPAPQPAPAPEPPLTSDELKKVRALIAEQPEPQPV